MNSTCPRCKKCGRYQWQCDELSHTHDFEPAPPQDLASIREDLRIYDAHEPERPRYSHDWSKDGERCSKCGDKDWMGGPCSVPDKPSETSDEARERECEEFFAEDGPGYLGRQIYHAAWDAAIAWMKGKYE